MITFFYLDIYPVSRQNVDIMDMKNWHSKLPGNEFDYLALMGALQEYKRPRDKVSKLLRRGDIFRIKKGFYILGPGLRKDQAVCREILANQLYGPSYISMEYALSWHQLIPEHVQTVTSVTLHKPKSFVTPVGNFTYQHVKKDYYSYGIRALSLEDGRGFLMAGPEKAIADKVYFTSGLKRPDDLRAFLFADLRIEQEEFCGMDIDFFQELAAVKNRMSLRLLSELARECS